VLIEADQREVAREWAKEWVDDGDKGAAAINASSESLLVHRGCLAEETAYDRI